VHHDIASPRTAITILNIIYGQFYNGKIDTDMDMAPLMMHVRYTRNTFRTLVHTLRENATTTVFFTLLAITMRHLFLSTTPSEPHSKGVGFCTLRQIFDSFSPLLATTSNQLRNHITQTIFLKNPHQRTIRVTNRRIGQALPLIPLFPTKIAT
jgi:hypothetical protein